MYRAAQTTKDRGKSTLIRESKIQKFSPMTTDLSLSNSSHVAMLSEAVRAFQTKSGQRPEQAEMVKALLEAEQAAKQQRLTYPLEALMGEWQLCFTAPKKPHLKAGIPVGKGFYVPQLAPAQISFLPAEPSQADSTIACIGNQVSLGALVFKLTGPARYMGKKNLLAFDFTQMQLLLGRRSLLQRPFRSGKTGSTPFAQTPIAKLPFFAFFLVTDEFIAARGRGGGLALWVRKIN